MNIILLGPQGSGKGTIGKHLYRKYGISLIGTGDLLREEIKKGTRLGKEISSLIDKGDFVSDEVIFEIAKKAMQKARSGFVLDGFPRNLRQVQMMEEFLDKTKKQIDRVIYIDLNENKIMQRLNARVICSNCNEIYNTKVEELIPKTSGICDKCNKALIKREDELPDAIRKRLAIYKEVTEPLKSYYEEKDILSEIDGDGEPSEVFKRVEEVIEEIESSKE